MFLKENKPHFMVSITISCSPRTHECIQEGFEIPGFGKLDMYYDGECGRGYRNAKVTFYLIVDSEAHPLALYTKTNTSTRHALFEIGGWNDKWYTYCWNVANYGFITTYSPCVLDVSIGDWHGDCDSPYYYMDYWTINFVLFYLEPIEYTGSDTYLARVYITDNYTLKVRNKKTGAERTISLTKGSNDVEFNIYDQIYAVNSYSERCDPQRSCDTHCCPVGAACPENRIRSVINKSKGYRKYFISNEKSVWDSVAFPSMMGAYKEWVPNFCRLFDVYYC